MNGIGHLYSRRVIPNSKPIQTAEREKNTQTDRRAESSWSRLMGYGGRLPILPCWTPVAGDAEIDPAAARKSCSS